MPDIGMAYGVMARWPSNKQELVTILQRRQHDIVRLRRAAPDLVLHLALEIYSYGLRSYDLYSYGLYDYDMCHLALEIYSYGLRSHDLCSYGLCSHDMPHLALEPAALGDGCPSARLFLATLRRPPTANAEGLDRIGGGGVRKGFGGTRLSGTFGSIAVLGVRRRHAPRNRKKKHARPEWS